MRLIRYIYYKLRHVRRFLLSIIHFLLHVIVVCWVLIQAKLIGKKRDFSQMPRLLWGPVPILNNKYWNNAMKEMGYESTTLMTHHYGANKKGDFDNYLGSFANPNRLVSKYFSSLVVYFDFIKAIKEYDIIHIPCSGFILNTQNTWLKNYEIRILKWSKVKIVVIPFGGDYYRYSRIRSPLLINVFLKSYPLAAREEKSIQEDVDRWVEVADVFLPSIALDGIGRWDLVVPNTLTIDTQKWCLTKKVSENDGKNGAVKIIHTPNHRGFKGTDFIIKACEELKEEGLQLELILVEGRTNEEVAELMQNEADILAEQLIFNGYALSGLEGMSSGLPVLANLDDKEYTELFYLFSFLNECPILSTTPYTVKDNLRLLITNPELRKELGMAGRKYVQKYHSNKTAQFIFENIYQKIWFNKEVDLMELFEPLKPNSYNNRTEKIKHPLVKGKLV